MEILTNMPCIFTVHETVVGSVVRELEGGMNIGRFHAAGRCCRLSDGTRVRTVNRASACGWFL